MIDGATVDLMLKAVGFACLVMSIFTDGHTRTYLAIVAVLNAGLSGMFA